MRGVNRIVNTSFWDDSKVSDQFTPEDKYFMLYLLTNPHTTQLGIYEFPISKASFELGYSKESVVGLLDRFENRYKIIKFSKNTNEILIKNFLRHSIVKGGKPVMDCLKKEESKVKDKELLKYLCEYLKDHTDDLNTTVIEYLNTLDGYYTNNTNNDNDNDNDNERIVHESSTNRYFETVKPEKRFVPPTVEEVREYCNSVGSKINPITFVSFYESKGWMIGKNKMKNWKQAIVTWETKNNLKRVKPIQKSKPIVVLEEHMETDDEWFERMRREDESAV